jgi:hypothetical protein
VAVTCRKPKSGRAIRNLRVVAGTHSAWLDQSPQAQLRGDHLTVFERLRAQKEGEQSKLEIGATRTCEEGDGRAEATAETGPVGWRVPKATDAPV